MKKTLLTMAILTMVLGASACSSNKAAETTTAAETTAETTQATEAETTAEETEEEVEEM